MEEKNTNSQNINAEETEIQEKAQEPGQSGGTVNKQTGNLRAAAGRKRASAAKSSMKKEKKGKTIPKQTAAIPTEKTDTVPSERMGNRTVMVGEEMPVWYY